MVWHLLTDRLQRTAVPTEKGRDAPCIRDFEERDTTTLLLPQFPMFENGLIEQGRLVRRTIVPPLDAKRPSGTIAGMECWGEITLGAPLI